MNTCRIWEAMNGGTEVYGGSKIRTGRRGQLRVVLVVAVVQNES